MKNSTIKNIKLLGLLNLLMDIKFYSAFEIIYFTAISGSMALGISIFSMSMISNAIFELPTGMLSDRIGRKKTLILGTISSLIYAILFAISFNYIFLLIAALFEGLERAFYSGNNDALLYDSLKEDNMEKEYSTYLGKTYSMYSIASLISALVGTVLIAFTSIRFLLVLTIIPKLINMIICLKIKDPKVHTNKIKNNPFSEAKGLLKKLKNNSNLKKIIIADTVACAVGETGYQFRPMFYKLLWPVWALGIPSILSNIGAFISQFFAGKIIKKFSDRKLLVLGNLYGIIANVFGYLLNNVFSPLILVTTSFIPLGVAKNDLINRHYDDETRASMASLSSLITTTAMSIVMVLIGLLADNIGILKTLIIVSLFKIITVLLYRSIFNNMRGEQHVR